MPFAKPNDIQEFGSAISGAGDKKCFVQVSAAWCGPCQLIKDEMEALSVEMADTYVFIYADCDKIDDLQEAFEVSTMPTMLIFKGPGAPIGKWEGAKMDAIRNFANENKDK